jgi:SAM-dependent methyltransferase
MDGRLRWVRADLRDPHWTEQLGEHTFDAVLSSTATHWLEHAALAALYQSLARLIRPGGVFLNFDGFPLPHPASRIGEATKTIERTRQERALERGAEGWQDWWDAVRDEPALSDAFAERDRIFPPAQGRIFSGSDRENGTTLDYHQTTLIEAGFAEADVVWRDLHKNILLAIR